MEDDTTVTYSLLNAASIFESIIESARSVVLIGGTMGKVSK